MKENIKKHIAILVVMTLLFSLCSFGGTASATDNNNTSYINIDSLPKNIQALLKSTENSDTDSSNMTSTDESSLTNSNETEHILQSDNLYEITAENSNNEGKINVFTAPVKYKDDEGNIQFIDTSMESIGTFKSLFSNYDYRNAANSFTVQYSKNAKKGYQMDNAFTVGIDYEGQQKTESGYVANEADGTDKLIYPEAYGEGTYVEYMNINTGVKENIVLEKNIGINTFDFTYKSESHSLILSDDATMIYVVKKDAPEDIDYVFSSLYVYDSYQISDNTSEVDSSAKHFTEDCHYEITSLENGEYKITAVISEEFLNNPNTVYPVTIDPSSTSVDNSTSNTQDTFVTQSSSGSNYGTYSYLRFGYNSGKIFSYIRYNSLPSLPENAYVTDAKLKLTFRPGQTTGYDGVCYRVVASQWYESSLTWDNQPYGYDMGTTSSTHNFQYYEFTIPNMVRAWYNNSGANYGLDFTYSNETYNDYNSVYSSEGATPPTLTIYYEVPEIANETYYIRNVNSSYYLDAEQSMNNNVIQYTFHGNTNQQWKVTYLGNGYYNFENQYPAYINSGRKMLSVGEVGNNVDLWYETSGLNTQMFRILSNGDGSYRILNKWGEASNQVVEVQDASTTYPYNVQRYTWSGNNCQRWLFERVETDTCSRAITGPISASEPTYDARLEASNNSYDSMSVAEYFLAHDRIDSEYSLAYAGALACSNSYPVASDMLIHFLENTGESYTLSGDFILSSPDISNYRDQLISEVQSLYYILRTPNFPITFGRKIVLDFPGSDNNSDWHLSINSCELWSEGFSTTLEMYICVRDVYDWDPNPNDSFAGVTAPMLYDMHRAGIAKQYPVWGIGYLVYSM